MHELITIQGLGVADFLNQIRGIIREEVRAKVAEELDQKLLSVDEARNLFSPKIGRTTLYDFVQKGHFNKYQLGGRVYFRRSEILAALKNLKPYNKNVT